MKFGCKSKSYPENLIILFFPLLIIALDITGINTASIDSSIFSINTELPFYIEFSNILIILVLVNLVINKLFAFSFSLIHVIPYNYGSIINGYLSELVNIVPFSVETESEGNP